MSEVPSGESQRHPDACGRWVAMIGMAMVRRHTQEFHGNVKRHIPGAWEQYPHIILTQTIQVKQIYPPGAGCMAGVWRMVVWMLMCEKSGVKCVARALRLLHEWNEHNIDDSKQ